MDFSEFYELLTGMTCRLQAGDVVADVLQDTLRRLQQRTGIWHTSLGLRSPATGVFVIYGNPRRFRRWCPATFKWDCYGFLWLWAGRTQPAGRIPWLAPRWSEKPAPYCQQSEAIATILIEKSQEVIHVNLLDSKNPVQRVLRLNLEGSPKAGKTQLRSRRFHEIQAWATPGSWHRFHAERNRIWNNQKRLL